MGLAAHSNPAFYDGTSCLTLWLARQKPVVYWQERLEPAIEPPPEPPAACVTQLLIEWKGGNDAARDLLVPLVYQELRRLADHYLRDERAALTMQPTALVHEAYLRLVAQSLPDWQSRAHFFGVAARLMRQILVDQARRRASAKRGSHPDQVSIENAVTFSPAPGRAIEQLDDALNALAAQDPRKAEIIELRYFGGFGLEEIGRSLRYRPPPSAASSALRKPGCIAKSRAPREPRSRLAATATGRVWPPGCDRRRISADASTGKAAGAH